MWKHINSVLFKKNQSCQLYSYFLFCETQINFFQIEQTTNNDKMQKKIFYVIKIAHQI